MGPVDARTQLVSARTKLVSARTAPAGARTALVDIGTTPVSARLTLHYNNTLRQQYLKLNIRDNHQVDFGHEDS